MRIAMPLRYLGWMSRDVAVRPGLACLVVAALFAFIATRMPEFGAASARDFLIRTVSQFDWVIVLIATAGLVSWDRASGYYRSLFSQPVSPGFYYLQRWLLGAVGVATFVPLMGLGLLLVTGSFPFSGPLLARLLLKYVLLGGLTFALSTLLRADWMIAFLISVLQSVLYGLQQNGAPLSTFSKLLLRVLPPFQTGSSSLGTMAYPSTPELTHALVYGAALLALALAVLALRPLGSGGRA